ncbi:MAG: YbaB/EbfC family nucleoid-associated protein [Anaerolineales bacterium]
MSKGFRNPKGPKVPAMGGQAGMMQQLQKLQQELMSAQEKLADEQVSGTAGGGVVQVTVTGDQRCVAIKIDPAVLQDADVEMLQDLILTAFNVALDESRNLAAQRLGPLTGGLPF